MGKLKTNIVNETDKTLQLFGQTPHGEYTRLANLLPNPNPTVETTERNPQLKSIEGEHNYLVESDSDQTYWVLRVWHGEEVVLSLDSDEFIDNAVITIRWDTEKKMFTKHCEQRSISSVSRIATSAPAAIPTQQRYHGGDPCSNRVNVEQSPTRVLGKYSNSNSYPVLEYVRFVLLLCMPLECSLRSDLNLPNASKIWDRGNFSLLDSFDLSYIKQMILQSFPP